MKRYASTPAIPKRNPPPKHKKVLALDIQQMVKPRKMSFVVNKEVRYRGDFDASQIKAGVHLRPDLVETAEMVTFDSRYRRDLAESQKGALLPMDDESIKDGMEDMPVSTDGFKEMLKIGRPSRDESLRSPLLQRIASTRRYKMGLSPFEKTQLIKVVAQSSTEGADGGQRMFDLNPTGRLSPPSIRSKNPVPVHVQSDSVTSRGTSRGSSRSGSRGMDGSSHQRPTTPLSFDDDLDFPTTLSPQPRVRTARAKSAGTGKAEDEVDASGTAFGHTKDAVLRPASSVNIHLYRLKTPTKSKPATATIVGLGSDEEFQIQLDDSADSADSAELCHETVPMYSPPNLRLPQFQKVPGFEAMDKLRQFPPPCSATGVDKNLSAYYIQWGNAVATAATVAQDSIHSAYSASVSHVPAVRPKSMTDRKLRRGSREGREQREGRIQDNHERYESQAAAAIPLPEQVVIRYEEWRPQVIVGGGGHVDLVEGSGPIQRPYTAPCVTALDRRNQAANNDMKKKSQLLQQKQHLAVRFPKLGTTTMGVKSRIHYKSNLKGQLLGGSTSALEMQHSKGDVVVRSKGQGRTHKADSTPCIPSFSAGAGGLGFAYGSMKGIGTEISGIKLTIELQEREVLLSMSSKGGMMSDSFQSNSFQSKVMTPMSARGSAKVLTTISPKVFTPSRSLDHLSKHTHTQNTQNTQSTTAVSYIFRDCKYSYAYRRRRRRSNTFTRCFPRCLRCLRRHKCHINVHPPPHSPPPSEY
jgi:hypothetical protein